MSLRWVGRTAVVTGGSSGIGRAIVQALAEKKIDVFILDLQAPKEAGAVSYIKCDLTNESEVLEAFHHIEKKTGGVDILVNNAGIHNLSSLMYGETSQWKKILEVNLLAGSICSKEALKTMRSRGDDGHIININSMVGQAVPQTNIEGSTGFYPASKYGLVGLTDTLRMELLRANSKIKVTNIYPGAVRTPLVKEQEETFAHLKFLDPEDVAQAVIYIISSNPEVQIKDLTIHAVGQVL